MDSPRLAAALAAIDEVNAEDPVRITVGSDEGPKEVVHSRLMSAWLARLDPDATEVQRLAARASHLRRWELPRAEYPAGRRGYLQWRKEQKRRHAEGVAGLLAAVGYDEDAIAEVQRLIRKEGLGQDAAVQTHEDALCLVFLETQLADVAGQLGDEKTTDVVRKTLPKMSARARVEAVALPLDEHAHALLVAAVESIPASPPDT